MDEVMRVRPPTMALVPFIRRDVESLISLSLPLYNMRGEGGHVPPKRRGLRRN